MSILQFLSYHPIFLKSRAASFETEIWTYTFFKLKGKYSHSFSFTVTLETKLKMSMLDNDMFVFTNLDNEVSVFTYQFNKNFKDLIAGLESNCLHRLP